MNPVISYVSSGKHGSGMFLEIFVKIAIFLTLIQSSIDTNCSPITENKNKFSGYLEKSSPTKSDEADNRDEQNVTNSDNSSTTDKGENNRGFPLSSRLEISDNHDIDYGTVLTPELPECILSRSEFYLSWWVNEDGTLKLPSPNREGNSPGFADLSFKFDSNGSVFKHVSEMTSNNPSDVSSSLIEVACLAFKKKLILF